MDLINYFTTLCRQLGVHLKTQSPTVKRLKSGKKNKSENGIVARYNFDEFSLEIYYFENLKVGGAHQVIWITFIFEREPAITFSLYDILASVEPENFNCYTYSYVDSPKLMESCFGEITGLLTRILPSLTKITANGVEINNLISKQKQKVNEYFGEDIMEAGKLLKTSGEKILSVMFYNYFLYQIDTYILGSPALFFSKKEEKALKHLRKAKYRSLYEENLLAYLEKGGKAPEPSQTVKSASAEKGLSRQGANTKSALKLLLYTLLFDVPVTAVMAMVFILMAHFSAGDSLYIFGIWENLIFIPFYALFPSLAVALNVFSRKKNKNKDIQTPPMSPKVKSALKYTTVIAESVALIMLFTCVNSTLAMGNESFLYSQEDFPLSRTRCSYNSVEYSAIVEGYLYNGKFQEDEHIIIVTKSGSVIDLYNATFFSCDEFKKDVAPFLSQKGIPLKEAKTQEDLPIKSF